LNNGTDLDYENHDKYIINILNLLQEGKGEEENLYFITNRRDNLEENTIKMMMSRINHPLINLKMKIIFCGKIFENDIPKSKEILKIKSIFIPGKWIYFIDDIDKNVEDVYHYLKNYKIDFN